MKYIAATLTIFIGCDGNSGSSCSVSPSAHSFSQNISNHSVTNSDVNNLAPTVIVNYIIKY